MLTSIRTTQRRPFQRRSAEGFTLVELLVGIAVLSLIMGGIAATLAFMLRSQTEVTDQIGRGNDQKAIGKAWTKDVQSVDYTGVNDGPFDSICPPPTTDYDPALESYLVSFTWDKQSSLPTNASTSTSTTTTTTTSPSTRTVKRAVWLVKAKAGGNGRDLQLVRRSRQHAEHLAVLLRPKSRCRAVGVGQHLAALETVGLLQVVGRHLAAELVEALDDRLLDRGIEDQLLPQHLGDHLAGAVVAGRPEPAGRDHDVGLRPALAELPGDVGRLVGDRHIAGEQHAAPAELGPDEGQVAVGREPEQQLIAEREQFKAFGRARGAGRGRAG